MSKGTFLYDSIARQKDININAKIILCQLIYLTQSNDNKSCNPSFNYLAQYYNISKRNVIRTIEKLIEENYISKEPIYEINTKCNKSNAYYITEKTLNLMNVDSDGMSPHDDKLTPHEVVTKCHEGSDKLSKGSDKMPPKININNNLNINNTIIMSKVPYQEVIKMFNAVCTRLSKVTKLTDARKRTIKARFNEYNRDIEIFKILFNKTNESDFLCGVNKDGWKSNFDWLLKQNNMAKVLEDRYINKNEKQNKLIEREVIDYEPIEPEFRDDQIKF